MTGWDSETGTVRFVYDDLGNLTERMTSQGVEVFEHLPRDHGPHQLAIHHPIDRDSYQISYDTLGRRIRGPHGEIECSRHDLPTYVRAYTGHESHFFYDTTGRRVAKQSGKNFTHYVAGLFEPHLRPQHARFLTPDPIWHPEIFQCLNPFSYVRNRTLALIDPSGFNHFQPCPHFGRGTTMRFSLNPRPPRSQGDRS